MAQICDLCGKGKIFGVYGTHKHSGLWKHRAPKSPKTWKPNLRKVSALVSGKMTSLRVCVKCLRSQVKTEEV